MVPTMIPSDRVEREAIRAVRNSCSTVKRSLLDFIDEVFATYGDGIADPVARRKVLRVLNVMKRRIHNDLAMLEGMTLAILEICKADGNIPPFGHQEGRPLVPTDEDPEATTGVKVEQADSGMARLVPTKVFNGPRMART